ncbi:FtsX-like permease family protein [Actinospica durhamensis]|uniref:FtsX-like permease family protein n=1 Tax=Actinospica durhamensis TaxID=1508375 RepID=A0A941ENX5_9ACTN|nr:FtsX-like permease family protein [Actinospica durhamensis]MBR7834706.1 FtsX-like permease family protein [Actinospica durhamensis]
MFLTYLRRELRRRSRQAFVIALGLAVGIGLAISVNAASNGAKAAQASVLQSLYGVGTDITVTQTAVRGTGGTQGFGITGQSQTATGTKTTTATQDRATVEPGTGTIATTTLDKIKTASGVSGAVGSLSLSDFKVSGTLTQSFKETQTQSPGSGSGGFPGGGGSGGTQRSFSAGPPSGNFDFNSTTIQGVDVSDSSMGPLSTLSLSSGRTLANADASAAVALVNSSYATQNTIKVGATETLGGTKFTVVGIVTTSSTEDYFIPLAEAQKISSETGKVTTVYVKAASSTEIDAVAAEIQKDASGATVSTSADLANMVSGSLASTASLLNSLGKWFAIGVLLAAFLVAVLFTLSAVGRRTRELGTLKALGWTSRRVVRQVIGESVVTGLFGGALGIGLGFLGAYAIGKAAPALSASSSTSSASNANGGGFPGGGSFPTGSAPGGATGGTGGSGFAGARNAARGSSDITVHLTAPVHLNILLIAVGLAVLGGLIAGAAGGWRASSLRPADALAKVS